MSEVDRAKDFYVNKVGFTADFDDPDGSKWAVQYLPNRPNG